MKFRVRLSQNKPLWSNLSGARNKEDTYLCLLRNLKMILSQFHLTCQRYTVSNKRCLAPNMFFIVSLRIVYTNTGHYAYWFQFSKRKTETCMNSILYFYKTLENCISSNKYIAVKEHKTYCFQITCIIWNTK